MKEPKRKIKIEIPGFIEETEKDYVISLDILNKQYNLIIVS